MHVRLDEARHERASLQIHHLGPLALMRGENLFLVPNRDDFPVLDSQS